MRLVELNWWRLRGFKDYKEPGLDKGAFCDEFSGSKNIRVPIHRYVW